MNAKLRAVVRTSVRTVNTPLALRRANRALADAERPVRLEIGGLSPRAGWVITNVNATARNYLDATRRWPLEDASVSHVYADNVIEHLTLNGGRALLREAHRCLQPGGVLRLVTPDLAKHVTLYLSGSAAVRSGVADFYRDEHGLVVEHPSDLLRVPIGEFGHFHGYVYDLAALTAELERAGFKDVREWPLNASGDPELTGLDFRSVEETVQMAVECRR